MDTVAITALKKRMEEPLFRSEMVNVFFAAMNAGYAAPTKPKKSRIAELPGSKTTTYVEGPWGVIDTYLVTPLGSRSGGMTVISCKDIPVWMMQYLGQYDEEAIPCLKAALRAAYVENQFFGGRGPDEFVHGEFIYRNEIDRSYRSDFQNSNFFKGYEKIQKRARDAQGAMGAVMGWHSYQGMMMI